jgi:hypothetical protein
VLDPAHFDSWVRTSVHKQACRMLLVEMECMIPWICCARDSAAQAHLWVIGLGTIL